jgi:alpha-tubulin suppressor-like RCC1 family protein
MAAMRWFVALVAVAGCGRVLDFDRVSASPDALQLSPGTFVTVANGGGHACGVHDDGQLVCWGTNDQGQLGLGMVGAEIDQPTAVGGMWSMVSASFATTCGVQHDGSLWCWGRDLLEGSGSTTYPDVLAPALVTTGAWTSVAVAIPDLNGLPGDGHACAIAADGKAWCWGGGQSGELGDGVNGAVSGPVAVSSAMTWRSISAGSSHTCAIASDGTAWCWGDNSTGQLGNGRSGFSSNVPVAVDSEQWISLSASGSHTCGVLASGYLRCWGSNKYGELGVDLPEQIVYSAAPLAVEDDLAPWQAVFAGPRTTCAITGAGKLYCWGSNSYGQLGNPIPSSDQLKPIEVLSPEAGWAAASPGGTSTCALGVDHNLLCFGVTHLGSTSLGIPHVLDGKWKAVTAGGRSTCGVSMSGELACWGANDFGQLGDSSYTNASSPKVIAAAPWTSVALAIAWGCAIDGASTPFCWGTHYGIGDGSTLRLMPTVIGASPWSAIAPASSFACGVAAGTLMCWGDNSFGECAAATVGGSFDMPMPSPTAPGTWTAVAAGELHACGISSGQVSCWGSDYNGQLGNGMVESPGGYPPAAVIAGDSVTAGGSHSCSIAGGVASCWGWNMSGQLGDGTQFDRATPMTLAGSWRQLSAGSMHTCGIHTDGTLWCWGADGTSQLGDGQGGIQLSPIEVGADTDWAYVSAGTAHTCALKGDATLWCWGDNTYGQLGLGTSSFGVPTVVP